MSDGKETAANIFDRTGKLAATLAGRSEGGAALALGVAAGISKAVAAIIRAVGVEDAGVLIAALARDKGAGTITPADVARDDDSIVDAVSSLYLDADGGSPSAVDELDPPASKPVRRRKSKPKT